MRERTRRMQRGLRWSLAIADITSVAIGILVVVLIGRVGHREILWVLPAIPVWLLIAKINRLYDRDDRKIRHRTPSEIPELIATSAITIAILRGIAELFGPHLPSGTLIIIGSVAGILAVTLRAIARWVYRKLTTPELALLIGSGTKAGTTIRRLTRQAGDHIRVIGYMAADEGDRTNGPAGLGVEYVGDPARLGEVADRHGVTRVVIADDGIDPGPIVAACDLKRLSVSLVPADQELLGPATELNRIADLPTLDLHFSVAPRSTLMIKRAFDLIVSAFSLLVTAPAILLASALIRLDSPGPVFFRQVRIGKGGRPFTMLKLRTMVADAEQRLDELIDLEALDEPVFKIRNDPRVTRVGRFLRRSSLDEVPQLINVLRGDMSLVGPRPEEEAVVALYDERQRQRLEVRPGLTGPMQVAGRGSLTFEERLSLERDYLDDMTIPRDISILLQTPRAVIKGDGAF
ncbi:MAG: sugar transferase [Solirubrobacterales bacterium]|nr:sugar transferase [Solirubrobacterales bacterium]